MSRRTTATCEEETWAELIAYEEALCMERPTDELRKRRPNEHHDSQPQPTLLGSLQVEEPRDNFPTTMTGALFGKEPKPKAKGDLGNRHSPSR